MERLSKSLVFLSVLILAVAAMAHLTPKPSRSGVTEEVMEEIVPDQMYGRRFVDEYKMDAVTYRVLNASGIISRVFDVQGDTYDTVLISSRRKDSFHDPNICFSAQGFTIETRKQVMVQTKTRGTLPVMILQLTDANRRKVIAAYTYKGPDQFYANTNALKAAFMKEVMFLGNRLDGVFYRFIPRFRDLDMPADEAQKKLVTYIADFLDACQESNQKHGKSLI